MLEAFFSLLVSCGLRPVTLAGPLDTCCKCYANGVDITDFTRYYEPSDWKKLPDDVRKAILEAKGKSSSKLGSKKPTGKRGDAKDRRHKKQIKKLKKSIKALQQRAGASGAPPPDGGTAPTHNNDNDGEGIGPAAFGRAGTGQQGGTNQRQAGRT